MGLLGLPFEFERCLKRGDFDKERTIASPLEALNAVNFLLTEEFNKMQNKKSLYNRMRKICDHIMNLDPFKYFTKIATIGTGGFGKVFLVEHTKTKKHFAMKTIKPEDESDLEDTLTEIALQNMVTKEHKNFVKIFHSFE